MEERKHCFTKKELNAEKNRVLAKFASVVSHDLKNVVAGFSNIAYYLTKTVKPETETQKKMIELLAHEAAGLNQKIVDLLDMTRVKQITRTMCNLKEIIEKAAESVQNEKFSFDLKIADAKVNADTLRMQQAFYNVFTNAKDAMNGEGIVPVKMFFSDTEVVVEIKDSGCGMDSEIFDCCMDPMFSTKTGKAMGMGLPVAAQVVEMHNGKFEISTVPNDGTVVKITLQLVAE